MLTVGDGSCSALNSTTKRFRFVLTQEEPMPLFFFFGFVDFRGYGDELFDFITCEMTIWMYDLRHFYLF